MSPYSRFLKENDGFDYFQNRRLATVCNFSAGNTLPKLRFFLFTAWQIYHLVFNYLVLTIIGR